MTSIKNLIKAIMPPDKWRLPVIILLGIFCGLGLFVLRLSKAHSYLGDKPETCVNCHIMAPQYATWQHSSHREVANCNDCHVPHNTVFHKYYFKAMDGLRHSTMFTFRLEPQVIFIKDAGKKAVHNNCIRCHSDLITDDQLKLVSTDHHQHRLERECIDCHRETPHGRVNSLSSVPDARVPVPQSPVPDWIKKVTVTK